MFADYVGITLTITFFCIFEPSYYCRRNYTKKLLVQRNRLCSPPPLRAVVERIGFFPRRAFENREISVGRYETNLIISGSLGQRFARCSIIAFVDCVIRDAPSKVVENGWRAPPYRTEYLDASRAGRRETANRIYRDGKIRRVFVNGVRASTR